MRREQLIVLVQPDEASRVTNEVVLKREGWGVLAASNISGALELVHENSPALLIVDVTPGRGASAALIRTLRSEGARLPILALCDGTARAEALAMGADEVEERPIQPPQLVKTVRRLIGTG